ncbi:hypothetical protein U1Q18_033115, partial [Sarracenia purpurea var. burkii]
EDEYGKDLEYEQDEDEGAVPPPHRVLASSSTPSQEAAHAGSFPTLVVFSDLGVLYFSLFTI